jgi:pimeloyl-ACP methyl ester carboxylesterase
MTIDLAFATLIPALAGQHQVIGVELQGHGRTADIDRAHVFGHSMGGAVTLELGVSYPDRVRSLVPASAPVRPDGQHEDLTDPARQATSTRLPTQSDYLEFQAAYQRLSPHPDHFHDFLAALGQAMADRRGWSDEQLAGITAPTLLVLGDHDFITVEHGALMQHLIPGAQLAILPGTTHMEVTRRAELLLPMLARFLD